MRKFIYQSIIEQLKTLKNPDGSTVIQHFDIWNENAPYIQQEQPFYVPAVFIEFAPIEWRLMGNAVREAAVTVSLHVITQRNSPTAHGQPYEEHALLFFDLLTQINVCLHGYFDNNGIVGYDALTSTQSITDNNFEEILHNIEVFTCHVTDCSAKSEFKKYL